MSDHEWCRDVRRDEAVRAAEDAAAVPSIQHRDLPEQVALLWASLGDIIGRVVRLEGEMDAGQDEEAAPAEGMRKELCESVRVVEEPAEIALRTERVTPPWQRAKWDEALAIICDGGDWGRGNNFDHGVLGALVIWADKEMDRLTAERDAALRELDAAKAKIDGKESALLGCAEQLRSTRDERDAAREECERLRHLLKTKESECETHHPWVHPSAAPAANAGGEKPQPPRVWLTAEERDAVEEAMVDYASNVGDHDCERIERVLRALLARSTPPKVKMPPASTGETPLVRDLMWGEAIRAAGGEVEG